MGTHNNMVAWFEVPVADIGRAKEFYEAVFQIEIRLQAMGPLEMGLFPAAPGKPGASGALVRHAEFYRPSKTHGPVLYFSCNDVAETLKRAEAEGAEVLQEKKEIGGGNGYMGLMLDSEGNRIALHSET